MGLELVEWVLTTAQLKYGWCNQPTWSTLKAKDCLSWRELGPCDNFFPGVSSCKVQNPRQVSPQHSISSGSAFAVSSARVILTASFCESIDFVNDIADTVLKSRTSTYLRLISCRICLWYFFSASLKALWFADWPAAGDIARHLRPTHEVDLGNPSPLFYNCQRRFPTARGTASF